MHYYTFYKDTGKEMVEVSFGVADKEVDLEKFYKKALRTLGEGKKYYIHWNENTLGYAEDFLLDVPKNQWDLKKESCEKNGLEYKGTI